MFSLVHMHACTSSACRQCDAESCVRLGLLGILPERLIGEEIVADFLLFNLNRHRKFEYVEALGLECPTNDVHEVRHMFFVLAILTFV